MSGETILLIDDDATLRELLAAQLHTAGYRTREAADGSIGLKIAAEFTPEEFAGKLPYALALGVETTWADRFAAVLGAAAVAQAVSHYYTGSSPGSLADVGSLSSSLGDLGSTASAAASPPAAR